MLQTDDESQEVLVKKVLATCTLALVTLVLSGPLPAHHSVGVFDTTTPIWVKGTVVSVRLANPHSIIFLDEKLEDGQVVRWAVENSAPLRLLERRGYTRDKIKAGDVIEACGYAPKKQFVSRVNKPPESGNPNPMYSWSDYPGRVITGRLLLMPEGPDVHWSHYGPLEKCMSGAGLESRSY